MRIVLAGLVILLSAALVTPSFAAKKSEYYGPGLCKKQGFHCVKIKRGQSWKKLFPNETQRDIVQRLNRTNMGLWRTKQLVVPDNFKNLTLIDVAPFPSKIDKSDNKLIVVDQERLAWGAFNRNGDLIKWGPISSGKNYCGDIKRACITKPGIFYVFNKKDKRCQSNIFPVGRGGAKMPYCMFFYRGFALHGSQEVPGYRDSHGCIRLFTRDAKWLNEDFVELSHPDNGVKGTMIVIQALTSMKKGKNEKHY